MVVRAKRMANRYAAPVDGHNGGHCVLGASFAGQPVMFTVIWRRCFDYGGD